MALTACFQDRNADLDEPAKQVMKPTRWGVDESIVAPPRFFLASIGDNLIVLMEVKGSVLHWLGFP